MKKKYFLLALLLGGCDFFNSSKEILPGNRQPYMVTNDRIKVTSRMVHVTGPSILNQSSQTASGAYGNMLALGKEIQCIWQKNIESTRDVPLLCEPLATPNAVYVLDNNSNIKVFDPNSGNLLWKKCLCQNQSLLGGGIATGGDKIYVTLGNGDVIAMESGGKICWSKSLGLPIRAKPLLAGGNLYILTAANKLFALNPNNGEDIFLHEGMVDATGILASAAPVLCDKTIILPYSSGELFALHGDNGQILWVNNLISNIAFDSLSSISHIVARPIIENDAVYALSHSGIVGKWQLNSGKNIWQQNIGGINTPAVAGNYMFVLTNYNELLCLDKCTGAINWVKVLPKLTEAKENIIYSGPVVTDLGVIITSSCGSVLILSARDGEICKTIPLKGSVSLPPVVANRHLYVLQDDGTLIAWKGI